MKNAVFWDVTACAIRVFRLLVTAYFVPSSPTSVTPMMEAINSSEILVLARVTRNTLPEDGILGYE
jgi:hypothetical protein